MNSNNEKIVTLTMETTGLCDAQAGSPLEFAAFLHADYAKTAWR